MKAADLVKRNPWVLLGLGLVALAIVGTVVWWLFFRPGQLKEEAATAKVGQAAAAAQAGAAVDAVATGDRLRETHERIERITRENTIRIMEAPGAASTVPAPVHDAWLRALCLRHAHQSDPACQRLPQPAAGLGAAADTGRPDPD